MPKQKTLNFPVIRLSEALAMSGPPGMLAYIPGEGLRVSTGRDHGGIPVGEEKITRAEFCVSAGAATRQLSEGGAWVWWSTAFVLGLSLADPPPGMERVTATLVGLVPGNPEPFASVTAEVEPGVRSLMVLSRWDTAPCYARLTLVSGYPL